MTDAPLSLTVVNPQSLHNKMAVLPVCHNSQWLTKVSSSTGMYDGHPGHHMPSVNANLRTDAEAGGLTAADFATVDGAGAKVTVRVLRTARTLGNNILSHAAADDEVAGGLEELPPSMNLTDGKFGFFSNRTSWHGDDDDVLFVPCNSKLEFYKSSILRGRTSRPTRVLTRGGGGSGAVYTSTSSI